MKIAREFLTDEAGIDAIEYGIIASLIFLVIIVAVALMAQNASNMWNNVATHVDASM
jgi:Flp pilus assembly pilin Flp